MRTDGDAGFARMEGASLRPLFLAASIGLAGACGSSPDPIPPASTLPANLRYSSNPATYARGVAIAANHVVTAANSGGSTSGAVSIEVVDVPVAAGVLHTFALVNGGVQCWGLNDRGQLGNNSTASSPVPVQVAGLASGVP